MHYFISRFLSSNKKYWLLILVFVILEFTTRIASKCASLLQQTGTFRGYPCCEFENYEN